LSLSLSLSLSHSHCGFANRLWWLSVAATGKLLASFGSMQYDVP